MARFSRLVLPLVLVVTVSTTAPATAQTTYKVGRVYCTNSSGTDCTVTCTGYLDSQGIRRGVVGGAWTVKGSSQGYLNDVGKSLYASKFEFTLTTAAGSTSWVTNTFDRDGNLHILLNSDVLRSHQSKLAAPVVRAATDPVVRAVAAGNRPDPQAAQRAIVKIIGAAALNAYGNGGKDNDSIAATIARQLALRAREGVVESALKDLFPKETSSNITAARQVICLGLDGRLSVQNLDRQKAKEELLAALKKQNPDAGGAAEIADFIYDVMKARR